MQAEVSCAVALTAASAVSTETFSNDDGHRLRPLPAHCKGIAAGTQLTDEEFWSVCCWLDREFSRKLQLVGPKAYAGCVWEAATRVARRADGKPVTPQRVWASAQGHVRTWDVREMTNAISVPRPRRKRKTKAEEAKKVAVSVNHFAQPGSEAEDSHSLTEDMLPCLARWSCPDVPWSDFEKFHYSAVSAGDALRAELDAHSHPGAALLREVLEAGPLIRDDSEVAYVPAVAEVAKRHAVSSTEVRGAIVDFLTSLGGDSGEVAGVLLLRGPYATQEVT